jgi:hypothetical protein
MPSGLRRRHRVAPSTWGRILVHAGRLRFRADTRPPIDVVLEGGSCQPIPPDIQHDVIPLGHVSFSIEFLAVDRNQASPET